MIEPDARWYETAATRQWPDQAWRDPWVFRDQDGWHMLTTARANRGAPDDRGVIGHATSPDLVQWTVQAPLSEPGAGFGHVEVVQTAVVDGTPVDADWLRRLTCNSYLRRVIIDADGLPLDVGREQRFATPAIWHALVARDGGCSHPWCDRPPGWCEAHHAGQPWCTTGETNVDEGVLLCAFHHRLIHTTEWEVRIVNQVPEFLPPAELDPTRRPRRNDRYAPLKQTARASTGELCPLSLASSG